MRAAMRQDPDVILVGEMRDHETVKAAIHAAETGHLVLSTLHTTDASETIARIIDFFPPHEQQQVRMGLAQSLRGIICQRLVGKAGGHGRTAAAEVLVNNGRIAEAILEPDQGINLQELVHDGRYYGMQTFDQHLLELAMTQVIEAPEALSMSTNPHDLTLEMRRVGLVV
jgi:twitching motility protein PilT